MLINESKTDDFSKLPFYLPSTTDKMEKINKFAGNVQLNPIDIIYEDITRFYSREHQFFHKS